MKKSRTLAKPEAEPTKKSGSSAKREEKIAPAPAGIDFFTRSEALPPFSYPRYLLETMEWERLAKVALFRVARALRDRVVPAPGMPAPASILRDYGVHAPEELPAAFARAVPGRWVLSDPSRVERSASQLWSLLPWEGERSLQLGACILGGELEVFGKVVRIPRRRRKVPFARDSWEAVDWERCPLEGGTPGSDPKNAWAVGRLEQVVHLALAYRLALVRRRPGAGDLGDAALDWSLDMASAPMGIQWACPMEVALRGANLAMALRLLAATHALEKRPRALSYLLGSLEVHAAFVASHLEDEVVVPNNHLLANLVGLLVMAALVPRQAAIHERGNEIMPRFRDLLFDQTLEDGFSFEGSVGYHRLGTELFVLGALAATSLGASPPPPWEKRLLEMFHAARKLRDGRGEAPQIGDEDSGRALPFRGRPARDLSHLSSLGKALFPLSPLPRVPETPESLWLFGMGEPTTEGGVVDEDDPGPPRDSHLPHAGIYLLRSRRMSCSVACGPNGTGGTGTHGHNDKLSLEVCVDGFRVIVDPGSGTYTGDPDLRNRFRSTAFHSTARVDGEEQQDLPKGRLFALPEQARARCLLWKPSQAMGLFIGEHQGYKRLREPVLHQRKVVLVRGEDRLVVMDTLTGSGTHEVETRYHLPVNPQDLRVHRDTTSSLHPHRGSHRWVVEILRDGLPVAILAAEMVPHLEDTVTAEGYGQICHATSLVFRKEGFLPMVFRVEIFPYSKY